jgi:hypothetical protein
MSSGPIQTNLLQILTNITEKPILRSLISILAAILVFIPGQTYANFTFSDTPLKIAIEEIQQETGYYFLYRESQVADISITLESTEETIFHDIGSLLQRYSLSVSVDHSRQQVLITQQWNSEANPAVVRLTGQVVDASTGERLPYATITWEMNGEVTGAATSAAGRFDIDKTVDSSEITLKASFIGYESRNVTLDVTNTRRFDDLTIRLIPQAVQANEIVVSGFNGFNPADTLLNGMIDAGRFSPLGESNSIRALQAHPAVSKGTALNDGLNIRGSTPDGFLVLLDGMSIFNQSHIYGLLDSFNSDAVQSSGFYYGVTPANIETPTGGSLNLITRTGSRNGYRGSAGISNTSVNGTLEGPLGQRSSWLISARTSYLDLANWFNNSDLVQWGLDINRPRRVAGDGPDFTDLVLRPGDSSARFVDVHTKLYTETASAGRFILSGYFGGNRISQTAERRTRRPGSGQEFSFKEVITSNTWGNALLSLAYENEWSNGLYSTTLAGVSAYETDFEKDDFVYSRITNSLNSEDIAVFTYPFQNRSVMNEFKLKQELEWKGAGSGLSVIAGTSWRYYIGEYSETSFDRPSYTSQTFAHLADSYLQTSWQPISGLELDAGGRIYFYSPDLKFRFAPRLKARYTLFDALSISAGYSVNYQFLHKVSIQNSTSADVWILSTEDQAPAHSRQVTVGVQFAPDPLFYLRAEIYQKNYENVRFHELNTQTLSNTFSGTPWFYQNDGDARGLELILRNRLNRFTLSQSYTWSEISYENPFLLEGDSFYAEWDRTHSYNAVLESRLSNRLQLYLSWVSMGGAPNALATFGNDSRERLDAYHRLDATLSHNRRFNNESSLEISLSVFNILDRENVWYRTYDFNFDETRTIPRLNPVPVDVLDLGFQPSFKVQYTF